MRKIRAFYVPGSWNGVRVVRPRQLWAVADGESLVLGVHADHVHLQLAQGISEKLFVGAVEQDGDEGVGGAAVGHDLVREEDLVDAVLVAHEQRLLGVLAPLSPRPETEYFDVAEVI